MFRSTFFLVSVLAVIAALLGGIKLGIMISAKNTQVLSIQDHPPAASPTVFIPSPMVIPVYITPTKSVRPTSAIIPTLAPYQSSGTSTYTNGGCGFSFVYPGSYIKTKTVNEQSTIMFDENDSQKVIAATCAKSVPRPPVPDSQISSIVLAGEHAKLYAEEKSGTTRKVVIVSHPSTGDEILLAGYDPVFQIVLSSFKFTSVSDASDKASDTNNSNPKDLDTW